MRASTVERGIRAGLPVVRALNAFVPLPVTRWIIRQAAARARLAPGTKRQAISANGVPCEWLIPRGSSEKHALLYLHGGGYVAGAAPQQVEMVAYLAQQIGIPTLMVDYRLAPEHPFPAPLDDCVAAYRWLLEIGISASNIVVAGDSAGGNLTITTLMKLRDSSDPLPAAAACLSPVADLSDRGIPLEEFQDPLLDAKAAKECSVAYVGDNDARNPLISPAYGDWQGLPPLLVHSGEIEFLRGDAVRIEELARTAGVDVRLEIYPRMWHVWQVFLGLPEAVQSLDDIAQFLESRLGSPVQRPAPSGWQARPL